MTRKYLLIGLLILLTVGTAALEIAIANPINAQELPPELKKRALGIEQQLLSPQCTNKRLDVCELAICDDMRRQIQQQLAEGRTNDEIIFFFSNRYGQRVLAEIPRRGFNLFLFAWVGASFLIVGAGGTLFLLQLRRSGKKRHSATANTMNGQSEDERWLEAELTKDEH